MKAYNRIDVSTLYLSRPKRAALAALGLVLALVPLAAQGAGVQAGQAQPAAAADGASDRSRILLVLPFDNRSGQPSLEWLREAAADLLSRRFISAGFAPMRRTDRRYALDHLGLPQNFQPSRASSIKLAQTLDADSIVVGSFLVDGQNLVAEARLVNLAHLHMSEPVKATAPMRNMADVFDTIAFKLTHQLNPALSISQETFLAAGRNLRMDAYEQYIRGVSEADQGERVNHLQKAVQMNPAFSPAWMAMGREQFNSQQYEQAAASFAKVDAADLDAQEAGFYCGLSQLYFGDYPGAEKSFSGVAKTLPLAEVLNNLAVAVSRQGHDATELFVKAAAADPSAADYHFNLAISLHHHAQTAGATNELSVALKLHPNDTEALTLLSGWKQAGAAADMDEPLERIVRNFDEVAFRQAEQMMDVMDNQRLATLSPAERARRLCAQAGSYLERGQLLEAERLFHAAVADDGKLAEPHAGKGALWRRGGCAPRGPHGPEPAAFGCGAACAGASGAGGWTHRRSQ